MEHLPLDARNVVDELRAAPRPLSGSRPRTWVPSQSFGALLVDADVQHVALNENLMWLHDNCNLEHALAPPVGGGLKGWVKRLIHRAVIAVLRPYLTGVQECLGTTLRAVDAIARRVDDQAATQMRTIGAVRADLIDFAQSVDERLDG